jgi:hypothetical protein
MTAEVSYLMLSAMMQIYVAYVLFIFTLSPFNISVFITVAYQYAVCDVPVMARVPQFQKPCYTA